MTDYYVATTGNNGNSGSIDAPWLDIGYGANKLKPGDTLLVRGGTYKNVVVFSNSGKVSKPITITNYSGEAVYVDGDYRLPGGIDWRTGSSAHQYGALVIIRGNHVVWNGINVRNSAGAGLVTTGSDVLLSYFETSNHYGQGIMMQGCDSSMIYNVVCHDVCLSNHPHYAAFAPRFWGFGVAMVDCDNSTITRTACYNGWGEGIGLLRVANAMVNDCVSFDNWAALIYADNVDGAIIQRNLCYWTGANDHLRAGAAEGINISQEPYSRITETKNVVVRNNIVIGAPHGNMCLSGDATTSPPFGLKGIRILNNTFVNGADYALRFAWFDDKHSTRAVFRNNIVIQDNGYFVLGEETNNVVFSNNSWSSNPPPILQGGDDQIGDVKLANPDYQLKQGAVDPEWFRPLPGSHAIDAGAPAGYVADDFNGDKRTVPYDIGAFEFKADAPPPPPPPSPSSLRDAIIEAIAILEAALDEDSL